MILVTQIHQVFYLEDPKNGTNWKIIQLVQNKRVWNMPKVEDTKNNQLHVLEIVVEHHVEEHIIEDDTLCRTKVDLTIVERPNVRHFAENFIKNEEDEQSSSNHSTTSDDA